MEEKYIVALEIGSSKIKGAIGTVDPQGTLSVKAVEEEKLIDGVRYGCIRNVAEASTAIRNVIGRLEMRENGRKVTGVYVSVGGRSLISQSIEVERRLPMEMEISNDMISDMISDALNYQLHERSIVGVTPKEFRVDNQSTSRAVGMFGSHIAARLNLISCRTQLVRALNLVLDERLHLAVNDIFVRQIAEADLVLYPEEKRQGCMLADIGAETTTVSVYKNGVMLYLATIPLGSRNITRDITALNILEERAEELKIDGGNALSTPDPIAMPVSNGQIDFNQVNNYVAARAGEIIANINEQIKYAGLTPDKLPAGIVLIGRGSKLNGLDRRLENLTTMKVRYGSPVSRIRILDGRINATDHIDVISILSEAARNKKVRECMTRPEPEVREQTYTASAAATSPEEQSYVNSHQLQPTPNGQEQGQKAQPAAEPKPETKNNYQNQAGNITVATGTEQQEPSRTQRRSGLARALGSLRDRVINLMTEPEEDDELDNN